MVKVVYRHRSGDPETTEWRGHTFKSGEAIDFDGRVSANKELIEAARGNPWFEVDGGDANGGKDGGQQKPQPDPDKPETAEQYRAYALAWIKECKSSKALERRWKDEEPMRSSLGWGSDDQALIDPIMQPKLQNLKTAEAAD